MCEHMEGVWGHEHSKPVMSRHHIKGGAGLSLIELQKPDDLLVWIAATILQTMVAAN